MFTADLSWSEPGTETVGQRRERKARERGSAANSTRTATSARTSISGDRDLCWTSSFKKAKSLTPNILRPPSNRSQSSQKTVRSSPKDLNVAPPQAVNEPTRKSSWAYGSALPPILPVGGSFDLQIHDVPELDGDSSSRRTNSTEPRLSYERRWEVKTPPGIDIVDEAEETSPQSPGTFATGRTRASSVATQRGQLKSMPLPDLPIKEERSSISLKLQGSLSMEALKLHEALQEKEDPRDLKRSAIESIRAHCPPITEWECLTPMRNPQEMRLSARPTSKSATAAQSSSLELTHFQRFIRRMENAGPKIILDRLTEDWQAHPNEGTEEEMALEKQLWLLTGFHMQNQRTVHVAPEPFCDTGRILELYGNLSEVFQASAMHPGQSIHFLTTKPQRPLTLPSNVSYLTIREFGAVPLPYPEGYFSRIRASNLPSLVPSSKLPDLFRECSKLLAPGGLLEIRVMDAAPTRKTTGPLLRSWIEDRLSTNLERLFRCSKPCSLVPVWLADSGFELDSTTSQPSMMLPCAFNNFSSNVDTELSVMIGRSLWKDMWGTFLEDNDSGSKWWWDDEDIIQECLERNTMLECRAICAYRK